LASINDAAENIWVLSAFNLNFCNWIGLNRVGENWVWSSGEPVNYTNWISGYPVEALGNYGNLYSPFTGAWINTSGDSGQNFIIERAAPVPLPSAPLGFRPGGPGSLAAPPGLRFDFSGTGLYPVKAQAEACGYISLGMET
jgi:hypothetical protein